MELLLTNGRKIIVNVARVKQYLSPETAKSDNTEKEEIISDAQPMNEGEIISHANNSDFDPPALTLSHTRRPGRPAKKVLPPSNVSFSKTRREKDRGEGENEDYIKNETKKEYNLRRGCLRKYASYDNKSCGKETSTRCKTYSYSKRKHKNGQQ